MNLETAIAEVQQILGWRSDKAAEITRALQYAQDEREKPGSTIPWFLEASQIVPTVIGQLPYLLPTDFIQEKDERDGGLFYLTGGTLTSRAVFLRKMSYKDAQEKFFGVWPETGDANPSDISQQQAPGIPREYVIIGSYVFLFPTPAAVYNLSMNYWGKAAPQIIGQENAWLKNAPWLLIGDAAAKLGADLGNATAVSTATALRDTAAQNLFRAVIHRQEAGRTRRMGSRL